MVNYGLAARSRRHRSAQQPTPILHEIPVSVLVVIHTPDLHVLVMERVDHPGFWQSVTGSCDVLDEPLVDTAHREMLEETGIDAAQHHLIDRGRHTGCEIYSRWRHRYAPGIARNTEHWFGLLVGGKMPVRMSPREYVQAEWLPYQDTAARCFSRSNAEAILQLPERLAVYHVRQAALTKGQA